MAKARPWIVTAHGPIERIEDNLWAVEGEVPDFPAGTGMRRRMTIIRLGDGRLVFHNAIPLADAALDEVMALGRPSLLIVPMHLHAIDAPAFRERLGLAAYTSKATLEKVRALMPIAGAVEDMPTDGSLGPRVLAGTRFGEAAWVVQSGARASLLFCDAVHNSRPGSGGFNAFLFKLLGFTGPDVRSPPAFRLRAVTDKAALRADLLRLAETPGLARLVPSHGAIVDRDAAACLREAATKYL